MSTPAFDQASCDPTAAEVPTVEDLLDYMGNPPITTAEAEAALDAALQQQAALCVVDPYTVSLRYAALRRAEGLLTARSAPLGQVDMGAFGAYPLIRFDAKVEQLEADYRLGAFA